MLSRTDALYGAWAIEKGHLNKEGWDYLRDGLDLPTGTPKAQIRSTLETYLAQTDYDATEQESMSGKDHWTYLASLDGDYDDSFGDSNEGDGWYALFLNPEVSFICRETPSGFWDIYAEYGDATDAKNSFENLRTSYERTIHEGAD
jgi:hypothetical protein